MLKKLTLLALLCGLASGCELPRAAAAPTAYPPGYLPTVIYLTAESINATIAAQTAAAITPSETPTVTLTPVPPTATATERPTPEPGLPEAVIEIDSPGPMSKIASPVHLRMNVVSGDSGVVQIDLYGEDGRLLGRKVQRVESHPRGVFVSLKIPFEVRAAAEVGMLQVSTRDGFGRLQSLNSTRLLLLSSGASEITPAGNAIYERVVLYNLAPESEIAGGVVALEGRFLPYNRNPLVLELVTADGLIAGQRLVDVPGLDAQTFATTIPYKVGGPTPARLVLRQADEVLDGPVYVYSQEIILNP
jgi:hypothetical protein